MELVSVIMSSHNSDKYIEKAVQSVLMQSHTGLELIVVDDGSDDLTVKKLQRMAASDSRLIIVRLLEPSGGPARPRNIGISKAQGEFLAFIDSDDVWHIDKLEWQLKVMVREGLNFLSTKHIPFVDDKEVFHSRHVVYRGVRQLSHQKLLRKNMIATSSVVITRSLSQKLIFSERREFVAVEDYLAWLYLHQQTSTRSAILLMGLVHYRVRKDSISSSKISMAKKVFYLLSEYKVKGRSLGARRFFFFGCYALVSIANRVSALVFGDKNT